MTYWLSSRLLAPILNKMGAWWWPEQPPSRRPLLPDLLVFAMSLCLWFSNLPSTCDNVEIRAKLVQFGKENLSRSCSSDGCEFARPSDSALVVSDPDLSLGPPRPSGLPQPPSAVP